MALGIYRPDSFNPGAVPDVPSYVASPLDLTELQSMQDDFLEIENDKVTNIETNYNSIMDTKDALTGIDTGFVYGNNKLQEKKAQYGIDDNLFKMSVEQLKDPFIARQTKSKLNSLLGDSEVRELIIEGEQIKQFDKTIQQLTRQDPWMAAKAKQDLMNVKLDPTGQKHKIADLDPANYKRINFSDIILEEYKKLPSTTEVRQRPGGNGWVIFDTVTNTEMSEEEFAEMVAAKWADSPLVRNNFAAQVDPTLPDSEKSINDPNAIRNFLATEGRKAFNSSRVIKSEVKEDITGNMRLKAALDGKTSSGGGTGSTTTRFDSKVVGDYGSVLGNELATQGYDVTDTKLLDVNKIYKDDKQDLTSEVVGEEIVYYATPIDGSAGPREIARFKKRPIPTGYSGSISDLDYINRNSVLAKAPIADKNMVTSFLKNPVVVSNSGVEMPLQDAFTTDIALPEYNVMSQQLMSDPAFVEAAAAKGITGNKLMYALHHHGGVQAVKDYVMTGKSSLRAGADSELTAALGRMDTLGLNEADPLTALKTIESNNNPIALYTGPENSSAFGAYQYTLSNWGKRIDDYMRSKAIDPNAGAQTETPKSSFVNPEVFPEMPTVSPITANYLEQAKSAQARKDLPTTPMPLITQPSAQNTTVETQPVQTTQPEPEVESDTITLLNGQTRNRVGLFGLSGYPSKITTKDELDEVLAFRETLTQELEEQPERSEEITQRLNNIDEIIQKQGITPWGKLEAQLRTLNTKMKAETNAEKEASTITAKNRAAEKLQKTRSDIATIRQLLTLRKD